MNTTHPLLVFASIQNQNIYKPLTAGCECIPKIGTEIPYDID